MKKEDVMFNIGIRLFIYALIFTFIVVPFKLEWDTQVRYMKYCHNNGWDGTATKEPKYFMDFSAFYGDYCYKEIPDESGVGMKTIYSGRLDIK